MKCCSLLAACAIVVTAIGCGGAGTLPAGGTITYKGQPVKDSNVLFTPTRDAGNKGKVATGKTDDQGKFTLGTVRPGDGALPGDYTVAVTPNLPPPKEGDYSASPPPPFPEKYSTATSTDLKATVKAGDPNQFPLELKD